MSVDDWNSVGEPISRWKNHSTGHISGLNWDIVEIQKPKWHFWSCLVQWSMCWCFPMLVDDRDCVRVGNPAPGGKITPLGISKERKEISSKFQNLSPHFRPCPTQWTHCRHCPMPHVYHRWKISWKTSSRWKNSFIGVGQLVKTGPIVSGVDGNVGVGFGISMISLPSPEILPMEWFFHLENLFSNVIFTCCHQVMSTQAWHGQVWSK